MEFHINIEKKYFIGFSFLVLVIAALFFVYAEGSDPSSFRRPDVGLSLDCAYATRLGNDPIVVLSGNSEAIISIGNASDRGPEEGGEYWGLKCNKGYKRTGCNLMLTSNVSRNDQWDIYNGDLGEKGQVCLTDEEEYIGGAVVGISCCKIVAN